MPNYDYQCSSCNHRLEAFQKMSDDPLKTCPHCQKDTLKRKPGGGIGLNFIGSGFYSTDYGSKPDSSPSSGTCCPCGKNTKCS